MSRRRGVRVGIVALALAASMLSACGNAATGNKHLLIATELPVSGADAAGGLPTQYGVDLAVRQHANLSNGYTLTVRHFNYVGTNGVDPSLGASDMTQAVSDPSIVAVIGPFNSGVAKIEISIITTGHLVAISPSNTTPGLTKPQFAQQDGIVFGQLHPVGIPEYYFRLPGSDDIQGKLDAKLAAGPPSSAKTVFIVDDDTTYGIGLADYFAGTFQSAGGSILGRSSVIANQASSFNSLANLIAGKHPDMVFFGGTATNGGALLMKALVAAGYATPIMGGDGIAEDPNWITEAGTALLPTYATVPAPDTSQFTTGAAATFVRQYRAAFPGAIVLPYSAMAYDAAMIEINAIENLIKTGQLVTREGVRDQVARLRYNGLTGLITFDAHGDNAGTKVFSVHTVDASTHGQWTFLRQIDAP